MSRIIIIIILVIIVVGGGGYLILSKQTVTTTTTTTSDSSKDTQNVAATITYADGGFSPASITVRSGDVVAIKNTTTSDIQLDSNPHPVHTDDTDLNVGTVHPGQMVTFTVIKKGSFGYHNHLNPSDTARIVIQ